MKTAVLRSCELVQRSRRSTPLLIFHDPRDPIVSYSGSRQLASGGAFG